MAHQLTEPLAPATPPPVLRLYQSASVAAIRAAFAQWRRVLYVLPTAGGKTWIFASITLAAMALGHRVVILAHRQEIIDQISLALTAWGVSHRPIQPGHAMTDDLVRVGMVQTVAHRLDVIAEPVLLIIDEAHHCVATTYSRITDAWSNAWILGVSATPERLDGVGLREAFDEMVIGPDVRQLIDGGFLAPFKYLAPPTAIDMSRVRGLGGDFNIGDLEDAMDRDAITGNIVEHYLQHLAGRTAIAFCVTVAHAEHVALRFRDAGIPAASIDGTMSSDQRHGLVNKLRTGDLRVLTSCEIISEGFDAPAVGGAILLRPTQSFALFRQQVGRCLRPKPDGSAALIVDHVGNVFRHGLPDAPHVWSLDSKKRTQAERQQATDGARKCPVCDEVFATGDRREACAEVEGCIFKPKLLIERAGELKELTPFDWTYGVSLRDAYGSQLRTLVYHAGTDRSRLRQIALARGYKPGWVTHALREAIERQQERKRGAA